MRNCYLCDDRLDDNSQTLEHIIPNSIGGRLKTTSLICESCNKSMGHKFDAEFAKFGNILASKYNIKKEKGEVQSIRATDIRTGEKLIVGPGYKLDLEDPKLSFHDGIFVVSHHDRKRATEELKRLVKQVKGISVRKEDVKFELIEENIERQFLIDQPVNPELLLRSVCKTIINFYLDRTNDFDSCRFLIKFLKEEMDNQFCWFLDLQVSKLNNNAPYHIILIRGDFKSKILYAYYEIFGEAGFLTLIHGRYSGPDLQINYTFDPIKGIEIDTQYNFALNASDIISHLVSKPSSTMVKRFYSE